MGCELDIATMEAARNAAEDAYFKARPQIDCNDRRKVFEAGYERGWKERNDSVMPGILDLLAVIHGDGGQHTCAVGLKQSLADAERIVVWGKEEDDKQTR